MPIPNHIYNAIVAHQPHVAMPWMEDIKDDDQKTLHEVFDQLSGLEGVAFNVVVEIRQYFLDRWKERYKTARPPLAVQNTLENNLYSVISTCRDDPTWLSWIITPLHKNTDAKTLLDVLRHSLDFQKLNTFDVLWSIAMSVPEHAQTLDTIDAFSPLHYLSHRVMMYPEMIERLHHNIQSTLSSETQLFALRILASAAFENGSKHNILDWVMQKGFAASEMEEIAEHTSLHHNGSIRSHEWMWNTRHQYSWNKFDPVHAKQFIIDTMTIMHDDATTSKIFEGEKTSAKRLWSELFAQVLQHDTQTLHQMIKISTNGKHVADIEWLVDLANPEQIQELLERPWKNLHEHPDWVNHPRVQSVVLHQHVEHIAPPPRASRKL